MLACIRMSPFSWRVGKITNDHELVELWEWQSFYCVFWDHFLCWCGGLPSLECGLSDLRQLPLTQLPNPQLLHCDLQDLQLPDLSLRFHFCSHPRSLGLINHTQILAIWNLILWMKITICRRIWKHWSRTLLWILQRFLQTWRWLCL